MLICMAMTRTNSSVVILSDPRQAAIKVLQRWTDITEVAAVEWHRLECCQTKICDLEAIYCNSQPNRPIHIGLAGLTLVIRKVLWLGVIMLLMRHMHRRCWQEVSKRNFRMTLTHASTSIADELLRNLSLFSHFRPISGEHGNWHGHAHRKSKRSSATYFTENPLWLALCTPVTSLVLNTYLLDVSVRNSSSASTFPSFLSFMLH